jgi:hypothetical protein
MALDDYLADDARILIEEGPSVYRGAAAARTYAKTSIISVRAYTALRSLHVYSNFQEVNGVQVQRSCTLSADGQYLKVIQTATFVCVGVFFGKFCHAMHDTRALRVDFCQLNDRYRRLTPYCTNHPFP